MPALSTGFNRSKGLSNPVESLEYHASSPGGVNRKAYAMSQGAP